MSTSNSAASDDPYAFAHRCVRPLIHDPAMPEELRRFGQAIVCVLQEMWAKPGSASGIVCRMLSDSNALAEKRFAEMEAKRCAIGITGHRPASDSPFATRSKVALFTPKGGGR